MRKIAMVLMFVFAAGVVFSPVVPTVQAAWYPCPVNGCRGHNSLRAVWAHAGERDGLQAVQRDNLDILEGQHRLGDHGDVWGRGGGGYVRGDGGGYATPRRAIFHPIEAGVLAAGITYVVRGSGKDATLAGVSAYGAVRAIDYFLRKREERRLEQPEIQLSLENAFRTNMVTVEYRDRKGPKVVRLRPGQRAVINVLAGTGITARINEFRRNGGRVRVEVKILQPGDGMKETSTGWVLTS